MKEVTKRNFLSYLKKSVYVYYDNEENDTNFRNLKRSFKYKNHQHRVSRAGLKIKYEDNINETIIENLEDFIGKRSLNKKWGCGLNEFIFISIKGFIKEFKLSLYLLSNLL